jgi:hypothetical protein
MAACSPACLFLHRHDRFFTVITASSPSWPLPHRRGRFLTVVAASSPAWRLLPARPLPHRHGGFFTGMAAFSPSRRLLRRHVCFITVMARLVRATYRGTRCNRRAGQPNHDGKGPPHVSSRPETLYAASHRNPPPTRWVARSRQDSMRWVCTQGTAPPDSPSRMSQAWFGTLGPGMAASIRLACAARAGLIPACCPPASQAAHISRCIPRCACLCPSDR